MSDHADLSDLSKFDLSVNHADYPKECLPDKLNNPSTKAKQLFFEEINDFLETEANQVAFKVSCDRIPIWIISLSLLYYDIYGKMENFKINWYDEPQDWSKIVSGKQKQSICIEIGTTEIDLLFKITFHIKHRCCTGTRCTQRYIHSKRFPKTEAPG